MLSKKIMAVSITLGLGLLSTIASADYDHHYRHTYRHHCERVTYHRVCHGPRHDRRCRTERRVHRVC